MVMVMMIGKVQTMHRLQAGISALLVRLLSKTGVGVEKVTEI
jgi:hypothetical protein